MNLDLVGTVRLLHRVFGFLAQQSVDQLTDIAEGRRRIVSVAPDELVPAPVVAADPLPQSSDTASVATRGRPARRTKSAQPTNLTEDDYAEIAAELRSRDSVGAGTEYLDGLRLHGRKPGKADLIEVARHLNLTLPKSVTIPIAKRRLVEHAIGARKKYADLQSW